MRHSRQEKSRSHQRIVEVAARQIREGGADALGVSETMKAAGMTHGGFYKHFGSRDDLVAEATERAFVDGARTLSRLTENVDDPLEALVTGYLSPDHRDQPGSGCAVAALSGDVARPGNPARRAYTAHVRRYIDRLQELQSGGSATGDRARAIAAVTTLVGALLVARAVDDPVLANEILDAARAVLTEKR